MTSSGRSTWKKWSLCIPAGTKPSVCRKRGPLASSAHGRHQRNRTQPARLRVGREPTCAKSPCSGWAVWVHSCGTPGGSHRCTSPANSRKCRNNNRFSDTPPQSGKCHRGPRTEAAIRATTAAGGSCSQNRSTVQPASRRSAFVLASRSRFLANLADQNSAFVRGGSVMIGASVAKNTHR